MDYEFRNWNLPKEILDNNRICDLAEYIQRTLIQGEPLNLVLVREYNELVKGRS